MTVSILVVGIKKKRARKSPEFVKFRGVHR